MKTKCTLRLMLVCCLIVFQTVATPANLDSHSLYQLELDLTDQDGTVSGLDVFKGQPVLIAMFYSSCPYACPLTIQTLQKTEAALDPRTRGQLRVLLVSLDSEQDTPDKLAELARHQKVDTARWKLARTDAAGVRKLAAVLGIRFKRLPDGEFNHSTSINLLDRDGVQIMSSGRVGETDPALLEKIKRVSG
ncbi:MAG TPA: SCO family protein [Gammaproteobacteria bacterium]|nr:SCO family protein [Gammaproteobacteria bacterium]